MARKRRTNNDFEPLAPVLEKWFGKKFVRLPRAVQTRVQLEEPHLAGLWDVISRRPGAQRNWARRHDIQHHPGLDHERKMLWDKSEEILECKRTASGISLENRTMSDVDLQETRLRKLRKEEAALEAALQQKAKSLGLGWPDDWGDVCATRGAGRPNAKKTSIALFSARRAREELLPKKQIQEAKAIREQWPSPRPDKAGPPKPTARTISGHISSVWREANKSSDKR
jgi:hypothetical protein